jgi:hypothetical protein
MTRIFVLIAVFTSLSRCQTLEQGWQDIKALKTTKDQVEKILGSSEADQNGYYRYRTSKEFVEVNYSTAPCADDQYKRGRFRVPQGTVLSYRVHLEEPVSLSSIEYKSERYKQDDSGDLKSGYLLVNNEDGVWIWVSRQKELQLVTGFEFKPNEKVIKVFRCS